MADSLRLRIGKAITAAFQEIDGSPAVPGDPTKPGWKHDLSATAKSKVCVFRGRLIYGDKDPLPMISILETPVPADQTINPRDAKEASINWDLLIQGFVQDDKDNPTDPAYELMADVRKRLAMEKQKLNGRNGYAFGFKEISDLIIGSGVVRPPDEVSSKAYFWVSLSIDFAEDLIEDA